MKYDSFYVIQYKYMKKSEVETWGGSKTIWARTPKNLEVLLFNEFILMAMFQCKRELV